MNGLFEVLSRLFGMQVKERQGVDVWHESVRFFDIFDAQGTLRGSFYLDCMRVNTNAVARGWMSVVYVALPTVAHCKHQWLT